MSKEPTAKPITQELLDIVDYRDGVLYWKVDRGRKKAGEIAGGLYYATDKSRKRWRIKFKGKSFYRSRVVWALFNDTPKDMIDHIDGDTLNDRIENLREASNAQNQHNRKFRRGVNGVKGLRTLRYNRKNETVHRRWFGVVTCYGHKRCTKKYVYTDEGRKECIKELEELREELHGEFAKHK